MGELSPPQLNNQLTNLHTPVVSVTSIGSSTIRNHRYHNCDHPSSAVSPPTDHSAATDSANAHSNVIVKSTTAANAEPATAIKL
ncbi:hypothetical protein ACTXT7_002477 [Hymenolepis weldensis]